MRGLRLHAVSASTRSPPPRGLRLHGVSASTRSPPPRGLRLHGVSASTGSPPPRGGAGRGFGDRPAPAPRLFPLILLPTPQPWSLRRRHAGSPRGETEAGRRVKWATMLVGRGQERPACWAGSCQHRRLEPQERVFLSSTHLSIHVLSHAVPSVQPASCFFPPALLPSLPASSLSIYSFSHLLFHPSVYSSSLLPI